MSDGLRAPRGAVPNFDDLVKAFEPNVVSYWPFNERVGQTARDQQSTQDAIITGDPERGVPTIVAPDPDGVCIAWHGITGEHAEAPHNAAHKTLAGTLVVSHQHDTLAQKSVLVCCSDPAAAVGGVIGGCSLEVQPNGAPRAFLRDQNDVQVVLTGQPGDVQLNRCYTSFLKWGPSGLSLSLWDDTGALLRRITNETVTSGLRGTSPIRFSAWHSAGSSHDGPYGRVVWLNRQISDDEEINLSYSATIVHEEPAPGPEPEPEPEPEPGLKENLPYLGKYYGCGFAGHRGAANTHHKAAGPEGCSYFFFAERNGSIDRISWQVRRCADVGYSGGDGGQYTIEIRGADAATKRALFGQADLISRLTGYAPGNTAENSSVYPNLEFTERPGRTVANEPYVVIWRNTTTSPGGANANYVSDNVAIIQNFQTGGVASGLEAPPANYQEPAGADPANPGTSPTMVRGWTPVVIEGRTWYGWPLKAVSGNLMYNRMGPLHGVLRYAPSTGFPNGQWVFHGAFPAGAALPQRYVPLTTDNTVARERFRVTRAARTVNGVFLRITRLNATAGTLTLRLEEGPAGDDHFPGDGGSRLMQSVAVPHTAIYDVGAEEDIQQDAVPPGQAMDFPPWVWVPFQAPQTLARGTTYNLRLSVAGGLQCQIGCAGRWDATPAQANIGGPLGSAVATWSDWAAQRQIPWGAWEDSRGFQMSTDGGRTWSYAPVWLSPICFRCV